MPGISPALLGELLDRHGAALVLFARQFCASADDVVQEAFMQLARQECMPQQPAAWLYRVVRNGALSAARAERRRRKHEEAAASGRATWFAPADASRLDSDAAAEALATLALDEREVIVAHLWGGLSFQEIARLTETSPATSHRRYVAGLQSLRERLDRQQTKRPQMNADVRG